MEILNDFNTTLEKALSEIDPKWKEYNGLIICGTHKPSYPESQIRLITMAREEGQPYLGICFGHQLAAVEYARNVLNIKEATSQEWGHGIFVVKKIDEGLKIGLHDGETYWNYFEVDYDLVPDFESKNPPYFLTCQFHPEYQSSKNKPHPLLVKFLELCKKTGK